MKMYYVLVGTSEIIVAGQFRGKEEKTSLQEILVGPMTAKKLNHLFLVNLYGNLLFLLDFLLHEMDY